MTILPAGLTTFAERAHTSMGSGLSATREICYALLGWQPAGCAILILWVKECQYLCDKVHI
jgi:hypothetical protein